MADELNALLERVDDEGLRAELRNHIDRLRRKRQFGLVFESHLPERVRLPDHPIRHRSKVVRRDAPPKATPQEVLRVNSKTAVLAADGATEEVNLDHHHLVVVAEFGEPIYPGLCRLGSIDRGGDKPAHVVIKGENYHALEALRFSHAGKVDCIYIDPPYNTGARDWKYDNDYVDESDAWRHSKWVAMMARRLVLAGQLLSDDGVLVVTIDEHEVHHLRMLLEQLFPAAYVQMVTIVVNPKGVAQGRFARVEEYALFCFFGNSAVQATPDDYMSDSTTQRNTRFWKGLLRAGTNALPSDGLGMVFPVFVDVERGRVRALGRTLRGRLDGGLTVANPDAWVPPDDEAPQGCVAVWPIRKDGALGVWQTVPETFRALDAKGMIRCVERPEGWALSYVPTGIRKKIDSGEIVVTQREEGDGPVVLERKRDLARAKTVWKRARHDAGWHGSVLLRKMLGERLFDFPRQHSFWDILANTVQGESTDLYVVLDEAHRGMKATQGRKTIVQRIIGGKAGSNPPAPIVWGISATIERFRTAMEGATDRTDYPPVQVDINRVRTSGLVKDEIGLDEPDEKGSFGSTLLREAVQATIDYEQRWQTYSDAAGEPTVLPALLLQVPDKASKSKLGELVEVIESEWPGLGPHAIAHVFGEHEPIDLNTRTLRWVHPESIQDDADVRIVMAKTAISTGWDCPRAEVLYSERPANDATHIAQVVGRMVRQPLAHRIATDDALNSVACFLPKFDRSKLGTIKAELEGVGKANGESALGAAVVRDPKVFERSRAVDPQVFTLIESLKGLPAPDTLSSPLRRARVLAQLLTDDKHGSALMPDAGQQLTKALNRRLDGLAAEYEEQVDDNVEDIETGQIHRSRLSAVGEELESTIREVKTHFADIDRDTRKIIKRIKEGAGQDYYAHCVERRGVGADKFGIRIRVAALLMIDEVVQALDEAATKWVQERLEEFAVEIKNTTGATRNDYLRVQEQTVEPEPVDLILRDNVKTATRDGDGEPLLTFSGHIYADQNGEFPVTLNKWERTVVETEVTRPSFVAWYRNPARATAAALRIAYQTDAGDWTSLQPDFLVVSKRDDGSLGVSIIDPHGDHLADARNKLKALARYADRFGDQFVRIESITEASDGALRSLDLKEESVREAVNASAGAEVGALYESAASLPFN